MSDAVKVIETALPGVLLIEPRVFEDARGFLFESFNQREYARQTGRELRFAQSNHSRSSRNVLRGLHYQIRQPQGKLVRAVTGTIFDVAVDLRRSSPAFGRWTGMTLSAENRLMAWIPEGYAHGFLVLEGPADVLYQATDYYAPEHERTVMWNDPDIGIAWPLSGEPLVSPKDGAGTRMRDADVFP